MMSDIVACLTTSPFQGLKNKGIREKKNYSKLWLYFYSKGITKWLLLLLLLLVYNLNPRLSVDSSHSIHTGICTHSNQNSIQASFFILLIFLLTRRTTSKHISIPHVFIVSQPKLLHFFELDLGWVRLG